jgi:two-component system phosphate regulon sensor histidine kinase PhoR
VLAVAIPYVSSTLETHQMETLAARLHAEARLVGQIIPWTRGPELVEACTRLSTDLNVRVTVMTAIGEVICESSRPPAQLENHADRPEVREALAVGSGSAVRDSATTGEQLMYAATREARGGDVRIIRIAIPLTTVAENIAHVRSLVLGGLVMATLLGLAAAIFLSRGMLRRIQRLVAFAGKLAAGEPPPYLAPERHDALGLLEAILRGMVEGVLVTDLDGGIVLMNARSRELLAVPQDVETRGRPLVELTRDPALADLMRELAGGAPIASRDVTLAGGNGPTLQVNAGRLRGADGEAFGFVLVLHDVTELRRLEVIRRDFVANVSHELRTPLTAIKGYAETLLGPAGDDRETARRFLAVIDRHSERLGRLINDLLALSDLELGRTPLRLSAGAVGPAVDDVLQIFAEPVARAGVRVSAQVAAGLPLVQADGDRLRQVLINLVDNAIKYTPQGGQVMVRAVPAAGNEHAGMVEIAIEDSGIGIPAQDLPRLTERFFRVDKARSRELGGTGLGLAIVKHIVQAHGGSLAISSALGQGTTVRVILPASIEAQGRRAV